MEVLPDYPFPCKYLVSVVWQYSIRWRSIRDSLQAPVLYQSELIGPEETVYTPASLVYIII